MTHTAPAPFDSWRKRVVSNLLLAFVAALGTHMLDIIRVQDRVAMLQQEQIEDTQWRIVSQAKIRQIEENDLPSMVEGQWMLNKRLCRLLAASGKEDRECSAVAWHRKEKERN